ncbi:hypothetical protein GGS23DRAFT_227458 [Durotheca rogersii]|uniref:uncharacterized protein n=1 Tax=Durotheca rogersii TaxID=419775 RepID=UPI0022204A44|nr:uncharacterized protein GGS23DRAFT_227458 [Durotheca rogersii]KAI5860524.1 hypothetical protein GGS23DRAFT_227458 [Durotheca rogersii]
MVDEEKFEPDPVVDPGLLEKRGPLSQGVVDRLSDEVDTNWGAIPLLACCFVTGLTDGTLYNAYGTFVSMQTGNTVFVALGTSGQNNRPLGWARSLCSIGCFTIGCFAFSRLHKLIGGGRLRRTLFFSFLLQTALVVVVAAIIQTGVVDGRYPPHRDPASVDLLEFVPVALLSFQAAGQIVNSRGLGVGEVPTVVITSLLCDLVSDEQILQPLRKNVKRNRRAVGFVLTLVGGICGGWMLKSTGAVQPGLWLVAAIKGVVMIAWLFIKGAR